MLVEILPIGFPEGMILHEGIRNAAHQEAPRPPSADRSEDQGAQAGLGHVAPEEGGQGLQDPEAAPGGRMTVKGLLIFLAVVAIYACLRCGVFRRES